MDWSQNRALKQPLRSQGLNLQEGSNVSPDQIFATELFVTLKQSYEERIQALEAQVKETYLAVENDEILNTMKLNEVSNEFRKQRAQEIVEDGLLGEKEAQIERLIQANAYLKTEYLRCEDENIKLKKIYEEEVDKFQQTMKEFEELVQQEAQDKHRLLDENERLTQKLEEKSRFSEQGVTHKESQFSQNVQSYQAEIFELKKEIDNLKSKAGQSEYASIEKEDTINDLKKDLEIMTDEYSKLEGSYNTLVEEYNLLKESLDKVKETDKKQEDELEALKQRLFTSENELKKVNNALQNTLAERTQLLSKSEYIATQARHIVEKEQKSTTETLETLEKKYQTKKATYKKKIEELQTLNQKLSHDTEILKIELNESKATNDKLAAQMETNMKMIKGEWEKKCQEIELSSQKAISELTTKYQIEITQLQSEYQAVLDRKLSELHNEASTQISKSKNADMEMKAQLESRVAQVEKDYISKTKHENILTNEILDLRASHAREIRELEEKIEAEYNQRTKELIAKIKGEYENDFQELKNTKKTIEQLLVQSENENQKNKEHMAKDKEKLQKFSVKLQESEKKQKELRIRLEETSSNLNKLKKFYEDELKKAQKLSQEKQELSTKVQNSEKKENGFEQLVSMLRNEISTLSDLNSSYKSQLMENENQRMMLEDEVSTLRGSVEAMKKEKNMLDQHIKELNQEIYKGAQRLTETINQVRSEEAKLQQELAHKTEMEIKLGLLEPKVKNLENKVTEKDEEIETLKGIIEKLERYNAEFRNKNQSLEDDLRNYKNENRELQKRLERTKYKFGEKVAKIWRLFMFKTENLRNEVNAIRAKCISELETNRYSFLEMVKDLGDYFQGTLNFERMKAQDEKKKEIIQIRDEYEDQLERQGLGHLQDIQREKNDYERLTEKYVRENENLRNEVDGVKNELQEVLIKIERTNQSKLDFQKKLKAVEEENEMLKRLNLKKEDDMQALQGQMKMELKRLKEDASRIMNEIVKELKTKNKQEIIGVIQSLDDLKFSNLKRLKGMEGEVMSYQVSHERYLAEVVEKYEKEMNAMKEEILRGREEVSRKEREKISLKKELDNVVERYEILNQENQNVFVTYEQKLEDFKEMILKDSTKYLEKKDQANVEIEALRGQVRDLVRELKVRDKEIEELVLRVRDQKDDINRYRSQLENRPKKLERSYAEPEKPETLVKKIDEIESLLVRPLRDFSPRHNNVDNSVSKSRYLKENQRPQNDSKLWSRYGEK